MPDPDVVKPDLLKADAASPPGASHRVLCLHCQTEVTFLPPDARFCCHCGLRLPRTAPVHVAPPGAPAWRYWWWGGAPRTQQSSSGDRSSMLIAYAKSMFGLGWRYEHAVGSRRNLSEAARCYWKAARLGNGSAAERLSRERLEDPGNSVAGPPPLAAVYSPPAPPS